MKGDFVWARELKWSLRTVFHRRTKLLSLRHDGTDLSLKCFPVASVAAAAYRLSHRKLNVNLIPRSAVFLAEFAVQKPSPHVRNGIWIP